ncbi:hypothetical protein [Clostridium weizhouense]|uniref:Uncharacterized protein n=1 Tax=Clostridium weizhouense TaxID=2859781 RepID=A0ABS7AJJ6_9CLOT|nr:hypothetical protein [Clostridium weizhouense]MBW6408724.1 hypothetical protein [Clostridium weizhouense]
MNDLLKWVLKNIDTIKYTKNFSEEKIIWINNSSDSLNTDKNIKSK